MTEQSLQNMGFRPLLDASPDAAVLLDSDGEVLLPCFQRLM